MHGCGLYFNQRNLAYPPSSPLAQVTPSHQPLTYSLPLKSQLSHTHLALSTYSLPLKSHPARTHLTHPTCYLPPKSHPTHTPRPSTQARTSGNKASIETCAGTRADASAPARASLPAKFRMGGMAQQQHQQQEQQQVGFSGWCFDACMERQQQQVCSLQLTVVEL